MRDGALVRGRGLVVLVPLVPVSGCSLLGGARVSQAEHRVHPGEVSLYPAPDSVSKAAWEWEAPDDHVLRDVLAGVGGAVMVLTDGVVGLAGATGEVLWRYRIPDGSLESAAVTPEGTSVVLAYQTEDEGELDVVVLDAGTGELRGEHQVPTTGVDRGWTSLLTENARLSHSGNGAFGLSAASLETGEPLWEFEEDIPDEAGEFHAGEVGVTGDTVVLSAVLTEDSPTEAGSGDGVDQTLSAVGLDAETGSPL